MAFRFTPSCSVPSASAWTLIPLGCIVINVNSLNPDLPNGSVFLRKCHQHIHFIFIALPFYIIQTFCYCFRKSSQSGLRVMYPDAAYDSVNKPRDRIARTAS